jgi:hypothetical protein
MTQPVASAFGAQWRTMEAKIVETKPIRNIFPATTPPTTFLRMRAKPASTIPNGRRSRPKDLAARRSGGHVAFIWYRTNLTIPRRSAISTPRAPRRC